MPSVARTHQLKQSLIYHIFNRGHNRSEIFHGEDDYRYFIKILAGYAATFTMRIYHWVLMPNHYHLAVELAVSEEVSSMMAGIGRSYVHYHHRTYQTAGCIWQGRFKSQPIQKELYLIACGRYIERNPVKTGITRTPWEYAYSSAAYYALGHGDGLTCPSPLFEEFGTTQETRQANYQKFLLTFNPEEDESFNAIEHPRGSEEFKRRLIKEKGRYVPRRQGRVMAGV